MATSLTSQPEPTPRRVLLRCRPRMMTRCECSGVAFQDVARQVLTEGQPLEQVLVRTGCGQTCGACVPDLCTYLEAARTAQHG